MTSLPGAIAPNQQQSRARVLVRRLYFYGVTVISLIAGLVALDTLLRALDAFWLSRSALYTIDTITRDTIASTGGVLLVATPIFLIHWGVIRRWEEPFEHSSAVRKLALYGAALVAVAFALFNVYALLRGVTVLAMGGSAEQSEIWPTGWLHHTGMMVVGSVLQSYFFRVLAADGDLGQEEGLSGTWRRIYQTLAGLAGLWLVINGGSQLLEVLWQGVRSLFVTDVQVYWWPLPVGNHLAQLIVGAVLLRLNWRYWLRLATTYPAEALTALRRFYLYAAVVGGALAVLIPATVLLGDLLLVLLGVLDLTAPKVWDDTTTLLGYAPMGLAVWMWHWRYLAREAERVGESSEGATIRRLYYYAVAATGLVITWFGIVDVIQVGLDWALGQTALLARNMIWAEPLAKGLSMLAVGAPVWAYHWRVMQRIAQRPDTEGLAERASGPRKVYLYGVALVGALLILFFLARVLYRLLLLLLGDPDVTLVGAEPAGELARSLIAAVFWGVHVLALRRDAQLGTDEPEAPAPAAAERRADLEMRIQALETELTTLRAELAELPPPSQTDAPDTAPPDADAGDRADTDHTV